MKKYYLVEINNVKYIMLNAYDKITNRMCNSMIFNNSQDANLDVSIFNFFKVNLVIIEKLDRRTKQFKNYEKQYGYFSASIFTK